VPATSLRGSDVAAIGRPGNVTSHSVPILSVAIGEVRPLLCADPETRRIYVVEVVEVVVVHQVTRRSRPVAVTGRFRVAMTGLPCARCRSRERHDPPGGFRRLGSAPVLADDEQLRVLPPAERAGEGSPVQVDRGQYLAALADTHTVLFADVGVPDSAVGIHVDPIRVVARRLRPNPPVVEAAVPADVEGREPVGVRLGNDQRPTVRGDRHPVREREAVGDQTDMTFRRDDYDEARRELAAGKVETDVVDMGVTPIVHHDVVPRLSRDLRKVGMRDQRPVGLTAQQPSLRRGHDQQPPVGEEVDTHRKRRNGHDHLVAAIGAPARSPGSRPSRRTRGARCASAVTRRTRPLPSELRVPSCRASFPWHQHRPGRAPKLIADPRPTAHRARQPPLSLSSQLSVRSR
jgi:hypothetical protein